MRVLMVSANTETINMSVLPLGMACVAKAVENAGHEIVSLNLMSAEDGLKSLADQSQSFRPHVIGISIRNIDDQVSFGTRFLLDPVKGINAASDKCVDGLRYKWFFAKEILSCGKTSPGRCIICSRCRPRGSFICFFYAMIC